MTLRRWILLVVGLVVVGFIVPFVLATTGGRHAHNGQGMRVQFWPRKVTINVNKS